MKRLNNKVFIVLTYLILTLPFYSYANATSYDLNDNTNYDKEEDTTQELKEINNFLENGIPDDYLPSDSIFSQFLKERAIPVFNNNEIKLLPSGTLKFKSLFEAIREAKHHIHLEYFNFRNDSIAKEVFTLLAEKAKEGVKVRAMFDDFGNTSNNRPLKKEHLKMLNERGVEIVSFDPMRFPWINHAFTRDHQKIVVIDGKVGYTGGMNIADYYINGLPELGAWRDMHMRLEGPVVTALQHAFLNVWNQETKQNIEGDVYFPYVSDSTANLFGQLGNRAAIVQRRARKTGDLMRKSYIHAMDAAEHHIRIVTPYFTPTRPIRRAINRALKRGVRVEIMISSTCDIPLTPDVAMFYLNRFRKAGARVYIFNGGFHHTKAMSVDDRFCTIGSANLNSRSMNYDYEINTFIFDLPITAQFDDIYKKDKLNSDILTKDMYYNRSVWRRFVGWIGHFLTRII